MHTAFAPAKATIMAAQIMVTSAPTLGHLGAPFQAELIKTAQVCARAHQGARVSGIPKPFAGY